MGGIVSCDSKKAVSLAAPDPNANEPIPRKTVGACGGVAAAAGGGSVSDYGAKFRFPLRQEPTITAIAAAFAQCTKPFIMWVDSNDTDCNRALAEQLRAQGVELDRHFTTASAIATLRSCKAYQALPAFPRCVYVTFWAGAASQQVPGSDQPGA